MLSRCFALSVSLTCKASLLQPGCWLDCSLAWATHTLAELAGSEENCTDTIEGERVANCYTGYVRGDATTPSTTCPTGCNLTQAVAATPASCSGSNDGTGSACALASGNGACAGDSAQGGYNCVYTAAVSASIETCTDIIEGEEVADCETGYVAGVVTSLGTYTQSMTCPLGCTITPAELPAQPVQSFDDNQCNVYSTARYLCSTNDKGGPGIFPVQDESFTASCASFGQLALVAQPVTRCICCVQTRRARPSKATR